VLIRGKIVKNGICFFNYDVAKKVNSTLTWLEGTEVE
jgi:hypothetical protein